MRDRRFPLTSLQIAGLANLLRKICAPCKLPQSTPCCFDHGCTGRAFGFATPRAGLPAAEFFLHIAGMPPGLGLEPSVGGGLRVEITEVASVPTNTDLDREHDDIMYPRVLPFLLVHAGCVA